MEWISVKDRLPNKNCRCLVVRNVCGNLYIDILAFCIKGKDIDKYDLINKKNIFYNYDSDYGYYSCDNIIYWMLLPELPKEEGDA